MIWLKLAGGFLMGAFKKVSMNGILKVSSIVLVGLILWAGVDYLRSMKASIIDLSEKNRIVVAQNEKILSTNNSNAELFVVFKKNVALSDAITEELIKKVEGIQNVKITEKTIIQTAKSNCLDQSYPDSIIDSGVLEWEEDSTLSSN